MTRQEADKLSKDDLSSRSGCLLFIPELFKPHPVVIEPPKKPLPDLRVIVTSDPVLDNIIDDEENVLFLCLPDDQHVFARERLSLSALRGRNLRADSIPDDVYVRGTLVIPGRERGYQNDGEVKIPDRSMLHARIELKPYTNTPLVLDIAQRNGVAARCLDEKDLGWCMVSMAGQNNRDYGFPAGPYHQWKRFTPPETGFADEEPGYQPPNTMAQTRIGSIIRPEDYEKEQGIVVLEPTK